MKIHFRLLILLGVVLALFSAGVFFQKSLEEKRLLSLFQIEKTEKGMLFEKMLRLKGKSLETFAIDYTYWDEFVNFLKNGSPKWAKLNLNDNISNYHADVVWVYKPDYTFFYSYNSFDDRSFEKLPLTRDSLKWLFCRERLCHFFVFTDRGLLEVRGATIHPSNDRERKTPPRGYFFTGELWNKGYLTEFSELTECRLIITSKNKPEPFSNDPKQGLLSFGVLLPDWSGKPVATLYAEYESKAVRNFMTQIKLTLTAIIIFSLFLIIMLSYFLHRWITIPISSISQALSRDNPVGISRLITEKSEFGAMARLIKTFFEQKITLQQEIVERKKTEAELVKARDAAEAANKAKSQFLAMMSHEIRTPMNAIIGTASLLKGSNLSQEDRDLLTMISQSGENLLTIINDILDFSKIESGTLELEQQTFPLHECIEDAVNLFYPLAYEKNLELFYHIEEEVPPAINGDRIRLHQILLNLIGNAIKFTDQGEVIVRVSSKKQEIGRYLISFDIIDTGIGISEKRKPLLFKSFSQLDSSSTRKYGGTGLGLAICKRLIELMGGTIDMISDPGKGSRFFFTLPADAAEAFQGAGTLPVYEKEKEKLRNHSLLLIEKNEAIVQNLSALFSSWGLKSRASATAAEALTLLDTMDAPDFILLDSRTDVVHLYDFCTSLKHRLGKSRLILLIPPGFSAIKQKTSCFDATVTKPVKPTLLLTRLSDLLNGSMPSTSGDRENNGQAPPPEIKPLSILLAEDNVVNQKVAQSMLRSLGHKADIVVNGLDALKALEAKHYDIILMDVHMPEMDGLEATAIIRYDRAQEQQPYIVALTAGAFKEDRDECLNAGMDYYLSKPLRKEDLAEVLEKCSAPRIIH